MEESYRRSCSPSPFEAGAARCNLAFSTESQHLSMFSRAVLEDQHLLHCTPTLVGLQVTVTGQKEVNGNQCETEKDDCRPCPTARYVPPSLKCPLRKPP